MQLITGRLLLITVLGPLPPAVGGRRLAASSSSNSFALAAAFRCGCCGATIPLLPVAGRQASLVAVAAMATLADV